MRCLSFAVVGLLFAGSAIWSGPVGPNLAPNPGFEEMDGDQPAGWRLPSPEYSLSTTAPRGGERCLRFENADAGKYVLCAVPVAVEKGRRYELSAWVRTENIEGEDSGATLCLEFWGAEKKYLSGSYPSGVKGTQGEWKLVRAVSGPVPEATESVNLTCYVRKGMTGIAYWDDVSLRLFVPPLAEGITTDRYRNETTGGPVRVFVGLSLAGTLAEPGDVEGALEVIDGGGKVVATAKPSAIAADQAEFVLDSTPLAVGSYRVVCRFALRNGPAKGEAAIGLHRVAEPTKRRVYIDEHQRLIVEGKPFFPLGMYWSGVDEKNLAIYADSSFNCLMPYGRPNRERMDWIHGHGLKVIASIKDYYAGTTWCPKHIATPEDERPAVEQAVAECREHPALLAWYLNDELPKEMMDRLDAHQSWIEELDPDHPTWVVLYQVNDVRAYLSSFDAIGTDPYPIPTKPAATALDWTRKTRNGVFGQRSVWQVPQVFDWRAYKKSAEDAATYRAPTLLEMRSMAWQCIAAGANGLVFYSWFDLHKMNAVDPFEQRWGEVKSMAAEIDALIPVILSVEPVPTVVAEAPEGVAWRLARLENAVYLIAVNSTDEPAAASFRFPSAYAKLSHALGESGARLDGATLELSFGPLEPKVVRLGE